MVRVLLVDDDALVRAGLKIILSSAEDLEVVGEADDGARAVDAVRNYQPDVVLMDIQLPNLSGIECAARLKQLLPEVKIIMVTVYGNPERIFNALRALSTSSCVPVPASVRAVARRSASSACSTTFFCDSRTSVASINFEYDVRTSSSMRRPVSSSSTPAFSY